MAVDKSKQPGSDPKRTSQSTSRPDVSETDVMPTEHAEVLDERDGLVEELKETADKLDRDGATRGDLKILSRAMRELRYAFKVFTPYRRRRKVTVFGSARTPEDTPLYEHVVEFGQKMGGLGWMVLTGAGPGVMEAANVGAGRGMSMGVNILLPFEQEANQVLRNDDKLVHLKYFFTRKLLFVKEVHAAALFPGGFGTLDEAFEVLTLVQTGKRDLMPLVLIDEPGGSYWKNWKKFIEEELLNTGMISPEDMDLFKVTDDIDEACGEILSFYCVYNSMRYVKGKLVLRLHLEPSDELVERLNVEFADIVERGRIEKVGTHPLEADDAHLADLPRLQFRFNRKYIGRLRQMVDVLNEELGACAPELTV
ncbi:LOG family protein [Stratiformator vulcanicus]|uniref:AMP nucleosidase n=1 Tax=Stratiformator vulcanicus TaxID=2527980 RepID=A0A517QWF4_9PLAN|nr:TIGR00730 family Rossman fold protein [Stratiformator vulcanicus]QDT35934.1 putative lysine decarboxylase [Stratiformator vulcanicus]